MYIYQGLCKEGVGYERKIEQGAGPDAVPDDVLHGSIGRENRL